MGEEGKRDGGRSRATSAGKKQEKIQKPENPCSAVEGRKQSKGRWRKKLETGEGGRGLAATGGNYKRREERKAFTTQTNMGLPAKTTMKIGIYRVYPNA